MSGKKEHIYADDRRDDEGRDIDEIEMILSGKTKTERFGKAEFRTVYKFKAVGSSAGYYGKVRQRKTLDGKWVDES